MWRQTKQGAEGVDAPKFDLKEASDLFSQSRENESENVK